MKKKGVEFRNHIYWYDWPENRRGDNTRLRNSLLTLAPYEVAVPFDRNRDHPKDLRVVGELTEGKWSAFASSSAENAYYFFELESDAMAFKLRWL